ncbi:hypothetical protein EHI8A_075040 [Entamoeba histolytica HM-1:IMSS-B]|uniref:C2 NT-type domain-containing protein n=6 Tax=Entamoeba histolytica TaxID=5759 RepID=C4LTW1_ENTH1|nr:hypothetical protein EHI_050910 [Entamoeba histolytica HM-1:IMSS]EMD46098.1 Hypothetical protein EHI5A_107670 [Entamoeba histolytica KU27]EMH75763.1 hypothetical protein EHI8A_075040 [Entamoeba histolytica HM-1:IMSS-B]ENY62768.1 hypothetical protein EHI7A_072910 [Entamoeba histolytica HM-1:IMSS-A]GAT92020.1 hypothetical protein CL6EHI_050910 [Entamoeba histolytica]EAL48797.1 hypothetical protein EHI_050910 [Entamoeba histolytica HM-1:IMSS]|eukprot:XP_654179.1 hypothetical protein EHI_050910 [Entamoeba histolytica HM-1:IMSS]
MEVESPRPNRNSKRFSMRKTLLLEKVHFDVKITTLKKLDDMNNHVIYLKWKRGNSKNSGNLKRVLVEKAIAQYNTMIGFDCTIQRDSKTNQYKKEKILKIDLFVVTTKGEKEKASLKLDLNLYLDCETKEEFLPFEGTHYILGFVIEHHALETIKRTSSAGSEPDWSDSDSVTMTQSLTNSPCPMSPRKRTLNRTVSINGDVAFRKEAGLEEDFAMKYYKLKDDYDALSKELTQSLQEQGKLKAQLEEIKIDPINDPFQTSNFIINSIISTKYQFDGQLTETASALKAKCVERNFRIDIENNFFNNVTAAMKAIVKVSNRSINAIAYWIATTCSILIHIKYYVTSINEKTKPKIAKFETSMIELLNDEIELLLEIAVENITNLISFFDEKTEPRIEGFDKLSQCVRVMKNYCISERVISYFIQVYCETVDRFIYQQIMKGYQCFTVQDGINFKMKNDRFKEWTVESFGKENEQQFYRIAEISTLMLMDISLISTPSDFQGLNLKIISNQEIMYILEHLQPPLNKTLVEKIKTELCIENLPLTYDKTFQKIEVPLEILENL